MLSKIHERIKGWVAGLIIGVMSAGLLFFGVQYYFTSNQGARKSVAKVNGVNITEQQLDQAVRRLSYQIQQTQGALDANTKKQLRVFALNQLINQLLQVQVAHKAGIYLNDATVEQFIATLPQFQEKGVFSQQALQSYLYASNQDLASFVNQLRDELSVHQLQSALLVSSFALPSEIVAMYRKQQQTRDFSYVIVPVSRFSAAVTITPKQIKTYYQQHQSDFSEPEKIQIAYVVLSPDSLKKRITVTQAELRQYYQQYKGNWRDPKTKKIKPFKQVVNVIRAGVIRQKTQNLLNKYADQLSDLAYNNPDSLQAITKQLKLPIAKSKPFANHVTKTGISAEPSIIRAAFSQDVMAGNNSEPIALDDGRIVVLRLLKNYPAHIKPLAIVKSQIITILTRTQAQVKATLLANKIVTANQNKLLNKQRSHGLSIQQHTRVGRANRIINQKIVQKVFALNKLKQLDTVILRGGDTAIVQLDSIHLPAIKQLTEKMRATLANQLAAERGSRDYQLYLQSFQQQSKIKVNN